MAPVFQGGLKEVDSILDKRAKKKGYKAVVKNS